MAHEGLACPECGNEVQPQKSIFCKGCGVNLSGHKHLAKKSYFDPADFCLNCHKPGGLQNGPNLKKYWVDHPYREDPLTQDYLKVNLESVKVRWTNYYEQKCVLCGSLRVIETNWRTDYDRLCWSCGKPGAKEREISKVELRPGHGGTYVFTYEHTCAECKSKRIVQRRWTGRSW